jgi:hypothetical protein
MEKHMQIPICCSPNLPVPFVDGDVENNKWVKAVTYIGFTGEGEHIWHTGNDFTETHLHRSSVWNPGSTN